MCDGHGRPIALCLTEGQMRAHKGAKLLYPALLERAAMVIGDKGYDSDEHRAALNAKRITACIPPRRGRSAPASFDKQLYRQRHKIENLLARLKEVKAQIIRGMIEHEPIAYTLAMIAGLRAS